MLLILTTPSTDAGLFGVVAKNPSSPEMAYAILIGIVVRLIMGVVRRG